MFFPPGRREAIPLESAVLSLGYSENWLAPRLSSWDLDKGRLSIVLSYDRALSEESGKVLNGLRDYAGGARRLLFRNDVDEVDVSIQAQRTELAGFKATEAQKLEPIEKLLRIDRTRLKDGGRLTEEGLEAIVQASLNPALSAEDLGDFSKIFQYELIAGRIAVAFHPSVLLDHTSAELYAQGWKSANAVVNEVSRSYPEIRFFRISMYNLNTAILSKEVVHSSFCLQHALVPVEHILALMISNRPLSPAFLNPERFFPGKSTRGYHAALVYEDGPEQDHLLARLFEPIRLSQGDLYLVEVTEEGSAALLYKADDGSGEGPVNVLPKGSGRLGEWYVENGGWVDRGRF